MNTDAAMAETVNLAFDLMKAGNLPLTGPASYLHLCSMQVRMANSATPFSYGKKCRLGEVLMGRCNCRKCVTERDKEVPVDEREFGRFMIVCCECGNKRCPHATDHNLACTRSNEAGQRGSAYA